MECKHGRKSGARCTWYNFIINNNKKKICGVIQLWAYAETVAVAQQKLRNSWFANTWQGGHVEGQYNRVFSQRISMKIEFSSLRREMLLFLTTNMAVVTSQANQQYRLFSQATVQSFLARLALKMLPETGERTAGEERGMSRGNRKNEKWDMVKFFPILPSSRS